MLQDSSLFRFFSL
jgi:CRP-like cAMP-binding protein